MFSKLKRPALALAVTAGLLAVAGPASAHVGIDDDFIDRVATGLKYETEVTDYVRLGTASDGHQGSPVSLVEKDLYQPDMTVREHQKQVNEARGVMTWNPGEGSDVVAGPARPAPTGVDAPFDLSVWTNGDGDDLAAAGPTGLKAGSSVVLMETIVSSAGADSTPKARSAVLPELDANANAFLPEVNDEVLAGVNYEPDYIEGMQ